MEEEDKYSLKEIKKTMRMMSYDDIMRFILYDHDELFLKKLKEDK